MTSRKWFYLFPLLLLPIFFDITYVHGDSMLPTLKHGQMLIASKWSTVDVGDVVIIRYHGSNMVKRLIAKGTETVYLSDSIPVQENTGEGILLDEGTFYFNSDNAGSLHGVITEDKIIGKIIYPEV